MPRGRANTRALHSRQPKNAAKNNSACEHAFLARSEVRAALKEIGINARTRIRVRVFQLFIADPDGDDRAELLRHKQAVRNGAAG